MNEPIIKFREYQRPVFEDNETGILVLHWSRQIGKSFTLASWSVDRLLTRPGRLVTVLSNSKVNNSFVTNMEPPDVLAVAAIDLFDALDAINAANEKQGKKTVTKLALPSELVTAANLGYLTVHHTPFTVRRSDATFVRRLDNYATSIFGGGFLLSPRAAAERAAAGRAAAKRIELSERERQLIKGKACLIERGQNILTEPVPPGTCQAARARNVIAYENPQGEVILQRHRLGQI